MRSAVAAGLVAAALASAACGGRSKTTHEDRGAANGGSAGASRGGAAALGGSSDPGGVSGTGGSAGISDTWQATCERVPDLICGKLDECAPAYSQLFTYPNCRELYSQICLDVATLSDTSVTPASYLRCFEAFKELSCDDWLYNGDLPAACEFHGTRPTGSACGNDAQCESGDCSASFTTCGVCEPLAGVGDDCSLSACGAGLSCTAELVCGPRKRLGDPCSSSSPCATTMVCENERCTKPPLAGEPCGMGTLGCDLFQGAFCDSPVCVAIEGVSEGGSCAGYYLGSCVGGTYCDATSATCVRAKHEGESCPLNDSHECEPNLTCTDGRCARLDPSTCN